MKRFVIFGDIEFIDDEALVHRVIYSDHKTPDEIESLANTSGLDYLEPHYFDGRITFVKFHEEK
jgi:hypothetical protein